MSLKLWSNTPVEQTEPTIFEVPNNVSLKSLSRQLKLQKIVSSSLLFNAWVRINGYFSKFKAGRYQITEGSTPEQIINKVISGDIYHELVLEYTIPEGFTLEQIIDRLEARANLSKPRLISLSQNPIFLRKHNIPSKNLEGFLYPATYRFFDQNPSEEEALEKMIDEFFDRIPTTFYNELEGKKISLFEAVTIASMIEKETMLDDERPKISEVIWNRLKINMPLGIDATIIYGIKDYDGNIRTSHLKDSKNKYNTRIHRGLPPGPIGSPSIKSLQAVVNPSSEGNFYYVLDSAPNSQKHHFTKTIAEHNHFVRKLVEASKRKKR